MSDQSKNLEVTGQVPKKTGYRFAYGSTYGKGRATRLCSRRKITWESFMSNLQIRVQRLEASEESGSEAMRAALERLAGNLGIDLTRLGVRQVLEDAFRAGTIDREGMVTWEELTRIFDRLTELARGGV